MVFLALPKKHPNFRPRSVCTQEALENGCSQKYTQTRALVAHYIEVDPLRKYKAQTDAKLDLGAGRCINIGCRHVISNVGTEGSKRGL